MIRQLAHYLFIKHWWKSLCILILLLSGYVFCLPKNLFQDSYCLVLLDDKGMLLGAKISDDGQWRFPPIDSVPKKFIQCITAYEDRRFYTHWGIDYKGIGRAIRDNWNAKSIKSGGSTISMQLMRLSRKRSGRKWLSKIIESIQASRLEWSYSKDEIMALYASHAPFGGNVVGLDAAAWRYYGKSPHLLSWGEAATLAVLPNSPSLIHPGRNRARLKKKRDRLLRTMLKRQQLDSLTVELALQEPLPQAPLPLPKLSPHLLERIHIDLGDHPQTAKFKTTIKGNLQRRAQSIIDRSALEYQRKNINNIAAIIAEVNTGNIITYIGNVKNQRSSNEEGEQVDLTQAARSSGSILKPFLYALMLEDGLISPKSLLSDVPTSINGYRPKNYNASYDGVVAAGRALERSLNVPLVRMLQDYGLHKFHNCLRQIGFQTINRPAKHYGLSLILGGAEVKLEDLAAGYAGMARGLNHFQKTGTYYKNPFQPLTYTATKSFQSSSQKKATLLSAASIYLCFESMRKLERPVSEGAWEYFQSARDIAWKTGTSFGFRDAWAVGVTSKYVIAVWVGNADGEGRPELVGVQTAAPILFELLDLLPRTTEEWFQPPLHDLKTQPICSHSGYLATIDCPSVDSIQLPVLATKLKLCPFHQMLHLDTSGRYQVHASCEAPSNMLHQSWFILPPLEELYYKLKNPTYKVPPPFREDCLRSLPKSYQPIEFVYPKNKTKIFLPINFNRKRSKTIFQVTHRHNNATIHWHLDATYIGSTQEFHQMELQPTTGQHRILVVDQDGYSAFQDFEMIAE